LCLNGGQPLSVNAQVNRITLPLHHLLGRTHRTSGFVGVCAGHVINTGEKLNIIFRIVETVRVYSATAFACEF
jgi:hypothetical protein